MRDSRLMTGLLGLLLSFTFSCNSVENPLAETPVEEPAPTPSAPPSVTVDYDVDGPGTAITLYKVFGDELSHAKDHPVNGNLLDYQAAVNNHLEMWNGIARLIPAVQRDEMDLFEVFDDKTGVAGYVTNLKGGLSDWKIGVEYEISYPGGDFNANGLFSYVVLHEFGHLLTLSEEQIDAGNGNCTTLHAGFGCAKSSSYLNLFFQKFWTDIFNEWKSAQNNPQALAAFKDKYSSMFVSDYAPTSPLEDIAESFTYFVISGRASGNSRAAAKINFFYEFPELVALRNEIREEADLLPFHFSKKPVQVFQAGSGTCIHQTQG